jgi:hypothetical protein
MNSKPAWATQPDYLKKKKKKKVHSSTESPFCEISAKTPGVLVFLDTVCETLF